MRRRELLKASGTAVTALTGIAGAQTATAQEATVSITGTNAPVQGSQWLSVQAAVSNQSRFSTDANVLLIVGHDPDTVDSQFLQLSPGDTQTVTLGYRTYDTPRTETFPVEVFFEGASDSVMVTVTPAP